MKYRSKATPEMVKAVSEWWAENPDATQKECAARFGVSMTAVRNWLNLAGENTHRDINRRRRVAPVALTEEQQEVVAANVGLVFAAALRLMGGRDYRDRPYGYSDALGDGFVGLCNAARLYDPALGIRFSTYATRAAINEIVKCRRRWSDKTYVPSEKFLSRVRYECQTYANRAPEGVLCSA